MVNADTLNNPINGLGYVVTFNSYNEYRFQIAIAYVSSLDLYVRTRQDNGLTAWKKLPTRAEMDAVSSITEIKDLGSKSTLSDFNNSLTTLASTMNSKQIYNIRVVANGSELSPFQYATYYGTLTKNTSTSFFARLSCGLDEIHGEYVNNNWTWVKIA